MTVTEAYHLNALLRFLFTGDSEEDRTSAEQAAAYLAGRAHLAFGSGITAEDAATAFARVFPSGWWELPPADDAELAATGSSSSNGGAA